MQFTLSDESKSSIFITLLTNLKQFTETIVINYNDEGIYAQGMDDSQVCLFEFKLNKNWFDSYTIEDDVSGKIGINIKIIGKILAIHKKDQHLSFKSTEDSLEIFFDNGDITCNKVFRIPLIEIDVEEFDIPEMSSTVDLTISSKKFSELISQFETFDDCLELKFSGENINMIASGEVEMEANMSLEDVTEYAIVEGEELNQAFSINHVHKMCNFNKLCDEVVINFYEDQPFRMMYTFNDECYMKFYLAPRMDE